MAVQHDGGQRKKLAGAARHWATGGRASRESQVAQFKADSERYGIPLDMLMDTFDDEPDEFEIWPENEASLTLFLNCSTQWDLHNGRVTSLNYPALHTVMDIFVTPDKQAAFMDMRLMESAALTEFRKQR